MKLFHPMFTKLFISNVKAFDIQTIVRFRLLMIISGHSTHSILNLETAFAETEEGTIKLQRN